MRTQARSRSIRSKSGAGGCSASACPAATKPSNRRSFRLLAVTALAPMQAAQLKPGVRSRFVAGVNGMTMHVLEAGFEAADRPCALLLHGFPELAYSWRNVIPALAAAGYHVIAPDQRGFGRTTGWDDSYDTDPDLFRILNMTRDAIGLVYALGHRSV